VPFSNKTSPYTVNAFTENPPKGAITQILTNVEYGGVFATSGSFGAPVQCYEAAGKAYIAIMRMYGAKYRGLKFEVRWHTTDGTAVAGVDYVASSGGLIWQDYEITTKYAEIPLIQTSDTTSKYFNVVIDGVFVYPDPFGTNGFALYIYSGGGNINPYPGPSYFHTQTFQVNIIRQGRGTLNFVGTPYSVQRPGGTTTVTLQVQRFSGFKGIVGCSFHTTDGTAIAGVAYTAQTGTLSWADGEGGTKNIVITILSGGAGTQSFTVTIDTPTGGVTIGATPTATVNITAGAPPANPVAGGSVPNQLFADFLPTDESAEAVVGPGSLFMPMRYLADDTPFSYWMNNITFNGALANKIGSSIGFGGAVDSFGGGTDFSDGTPFYDPLTNVNRYQGLVTGGG